ncbi:MAG: ATP-binding cassette domain-containing protein, partial [Evtepia sp.]
EFVVLCGKSGCGKSTLLRQLKTVLTPHGTQNGEILFCDRALSSWDQRSQSQKIGFVQQSPENQIVTDKVWHELAFGLESLGYKTPEIRVRVAEMASFFGIQTWFHEKTSALSGGQKQILNLAAVMVMEPGVLILDEPTSQLDPIAAGDFLSILYKINRELGTTIILSEHRLEEALPYADRLVVLEAGSVLADGTPSHVGTQLKHHPLFAAMPTPMRIYAAIPNDLACPVTVREGREWLSQLNRTPNPTWLQEQDTAPHFEETVIECKELWFHYDTKDVIRALNLRVKRGEFLALLGGNGAGKTTLLSLLSGRLEACRGTLRINDPSIVALPQNPQALFLHKTVALELKDETFLSLCQLEPLLSVHPYDLSGGEQQRLALAKVLERNPRILLLDEPTKGLDAEFKAVFAQILKQLQNDGVTIIMASHDVEFCAQYASRCALFFDGNIVSEGEPRHFFAGKSFYSTAANRMARHLLPNAILAEDVIAAFGGTVTKPPQAKPTPTPPPTETPYREPKKIKKSKATLHPLDLLLFLMIPLTIFFGTALFGDRKYYFISLLILLEAMVPFLLRFELKKPQAREIVLLAVLCALIVAGRAAFFMVPQFKPVVALSILVGVCFGAETGFLVGAASAFLSNFFFGQGP